MLKLEDISPARLSTWRRLRRACSIISVPPWNGKCRNTFGCLSDHRTTSKVDRKSTRLNSSHSQISYADHTHLHSFPTRRSSDLVGVTVYRYMEYLLVLDAQIGGYKPSKTFNMAQIEKGMFYNFGATVEREMSEYLRLFIRPSYDIKSRSEEHTSELQSQSNLVCRPHTSTLFPYTTLFRSGGRNRLPVHGIPVGA